MAEKRKPLDEELISKFIEDVLFLESLYKRINIAQNLGIDKGRLSKIVNNRKSLTPEIRELFYKKYGEAIERYGRERPSMVQESPEPYGFDFEAAFTFIKDELSKIVQRQDEQDKYMADIVRRLNISPDQEPHSPEN